MPSGLGICHAMRDYHFVTSITFPFAHRPMAKIVNLSDNFRTSAPSTFEDGPLLSIGYRHVPTVYRLQHRCRSSPFIAR
jgi:hypothetical protein